MRSHYLTSVLSHTQNHYFTATRFFIACKQFRSSTMFSTATSKIAEPKTSQFITLSNGVQMPRIGLGTWKLSNEAECSEAVRNSLKAKYQLIDTASVYRNESFIGSEVAKFHGYGDEFHLETSNGKGVFISSKVGPHQMGFDNAYKACLETLQKLGQTSIDLFLLHWPGVTKVPPTSEVHRKVRHESWKALELLYKEKKVRAIGVCNFQSHHLETLVQDGVEIMPMVDQIEIHPLCPNHELRQTASELGIIVQAYSSLGSGSKDLLEHQTVIEVAEIEDKTVSQVLLRWAIQQNIIVIPRSRRYKHQCDNINVLNWELSPESMNLLNRLCPKDLGTAAEKHFCWHSINIP